MRNDNAGERLPASGHVRTTTGPEGCSALSGPETRQGRPTSSGLISSEERFQLLFEQAVDGIFVADQEGHYLDVNTSGCEMLGYSREELLSKTIADIITPGDRERLLPEVARLAGGQVARSEWRFVRKDGSSFIGEVVGRQLPDGRLQGILRDITERRKAEEALRISEERLRKLGDNLPNSAIYQYMVPREGPGWFSYLSAGIEKLTGVKVEEALKDASKVRGLVPREYLERLAAEEARCTCELKDFQFDVPLHRTDGDLRWMSVRSRPSRLPDGTVVWDGVQTDVTEIKRANEAVRESEERYRTLFESIDEGFSTVEVLFDQNNKAVDYRFLAVNPAFEQQTGIRNAVGRGMREIAPRHEEDWFRVYGEVVLTGQPVRFEHPATELGRFFDVYAFRIGPPATRQIGILFKDITERKKAEAVLARDKEELEKLVSERTARLQELVGELEHFSYTITHDLKSPLRAMRGFAEVACQVCGAPEARPYLEKISSAAERMDVLIRDALNFSQAVRNELPLADVDTAALLRGILDSYPDFQPSRAHIKVEEPLPVVLGNEAGLTQCFSNLLGNAVKFVKPGCTPEVRIRAEKQAGWSRIWIEDAGIGISKEMLPRVFNMFSRGSKDYEGTGIGLALVRKVVQRMGGRAGVESEEGKGSRFWVELKTGEARPRIERAAGTEPKLKGQTFLYVEDEECDATFMRMAFAAKGLESALRVVDDGRKAIEYLSGTGQYADRQEYPLPDVVLLDLNLPAVPGFEVLQWMRNHPDFGSTPVVVFSSSTRDDDLARARELGAKDFLAKPSSGLEFGRIVDHLRDHLLA